MEEGIERHDGEGGNGRKVCSSLYRDEAALGDNNDLYGDKMVATSRSGSEEVAAAQRAGCCECPIRMLCL